MSGSLNQVRWLRDLLIQFRSSFEIVTDCDAEHIFCPRHFHFRVDRIVPVKLLGKNPFPSMAAV